MISIFTLEAKLNAEAANRAKAGWRNVYVRKLPAGFVVPGGNALDSSDEAALNARNA